MAEASFRLPLDIHFYGPGDVPFAYPPRAWKWGAEWLGTYYSASGLVGAINDCRRAQDVECLRDLHLNLASNDILITLREDKRLTVDLEGRPDCPQVTVIGQYIVWKVGCLLSNQTAQVMQ